MVAQPLEKAHTRSMSLVHLNELIQSKTTIGTTNISTVLMVEMN